MQGAAPAALAQLPGDQHVHDAVPQQQYRAVAFGQVDQAVGRLGGPY